MKIKSFLPALLAACTLAIAATSCSSDKTADAEGLLKTVPSDATLVAVANVRSILDKTGSKIDGSSVELSKSLNQALSAVSDPNTRQILQSCLSGDGGLEPVVVALFQEGYYTYATGILADTDKFKEFVNKSFGGSFKEENDVEYCRNFAIKENQFWCNLSNTSVDPKEILHFATLDESQSFMSVKAAEELVTVDKDIKGWGNLAGLMNSSQLSFQQRAEMQMGTELLFNDAKMISFDINFEKGKMIANTRILNSKGKPVEFLFPTGKIDPEVVKKLGNAELFCAVQIPNKLVKDLIKKTSGSGLSMLGIYAKAMAPVNGTFAMAQTGENSQGLLQVEGDNTADLMSGLKTLFNSEVKKDGNLLTFSKGSLSGSLTGAECADLFKGAMIAAAAGKNANPDFESIPAFKHIVVTATPAHDSLELQLTLTADTKDNIIISLLQAASK